jgi:hypothetical protein
MNNTRHMLKDWSRRMQRIWMTIVVLTLFLVPAGSAANTQLPRACMVTVNQAGDPGLPQHVIPGFTTLHTPEGRVELPVYPEEHSMYGQNGLWFRIPDNGILAPPDEARINEDGTIEWIKFGIYRDDEARGNVEMTGALRDDPDVKMAAHLPDGYGTVGFQVGGATFPQPGCWEITITSGAAVLTFTIMVLREPFDLATPAAA